MSKVYYKNNKFEVNSEFIKTPYRSFMLSNLESVDLHRRFLILVGAICGGMFLFGIIFFDLLHWYEILLFLIISAAAVYGARNLATLTLHSKMTNAGHNHGWSIIWARPVLVEVRNALEQAIIETRKRPSSGGVSHTHDHDDHGHDDDPGHDSGDDGH